MDSHCECQKGWLEPLLQKVAQDRYLFIIITPQCLSDKFSGAMEPSQSLSLTKQTLHDSYYSFQTA